MYFNLPAAVYVETVRDLYIIHKENDTHTHTHKLARTNTHTHTVYIDTIEFY